MVHIHKFFQKKRPKLKPLCFSFGLYLTYLFFAF